MAYDVEVRTGNGNHAALLQNLLRHRRDPHIRSFHAFEQIQLTSAVIDIDFPRVVRGGRSGGRKICQSESRHLVISMNDLRVGDQILQPDFLLGG